MAWLRLHRFCLRSWDLKDLPREFRPETQDFITTVFGRSACHITHLIPRPEVVRWPLRHLRSLTRTDRFRWSLLPHGVLAEIEAIVTLKE